MVYYGVYLVMRVLGIGEYCVTNDKKSIIKTYSLGSCVALTMYCSTRKVSGMAHIALPTSVNTEIEKHPPAYFADMAISLMLNEFCYNYGCRLQNLQIGMFGGASSLRKNDVFKIGSKNVEKIKRILLNKNMVVYKEDIGGHYSRTVEIDVETGIVKVNCHPIVI